MDINIWPYIELSRLLIKKERKGFGNMFRHQFETFVILIEFGYSDPVLLKAALIHDLFEDGEKIGFLKFESIKDIDEDGKNVYELVVEISIRIENNHEELKSVFLERIMKEGSSKAKLLKLADRLSNINTLLATRDKQFIKRYTEETKIYILPFAEKIDKNIFTELVKSIKILDDARI